MNRPIPSPPSSKAAPVTISRQPSQDRRRFADFLAGFFFMLVRGGKDRRHYKRPARRVARRPRSGLEWGARISRGLAGEMSGFTHFDAQGRAVMVDVGDKPETERIATAAGTVHVQPETLERIRAGGVAKGDVLSVARLAGIMGAKRTPDLIPLCHPLGLTSVAVDLTCDAERNSIDITATCKLTGRTGGEMEALTAVSVAAVTVYDRLKAVDRGMLRT